MPELIPDKPWTCPSCNKEHKAPHFAHPGQVDESLKPGDVGRIKFNRRKKDDSLDTSQKIRYDLPDEADAFDEDGFQKPLFCPHCGWMQDWLVIKRKGPRKGLIEQFLLVVNGNIEEMSGKDAVSQFMGFLKGKGIVK